jgi:hypothetical protein
MDREIVLHLVAPRQLFVFDSATYDPFDPGALGQSGVDELFQLAHAGWLGPRRLRATLCVPAATFTPGLERQMRDAFKRYCEGQLAANRQAHREFLATNVFYLALAILVLAVGLWLQHQLAVSDLIDPGELRDALQTGILVLIWVVVWTPVSGFVLEWVPFARTRRAWRAMLTMDLAVHPEHRPPAPS